MSAGAVFQLITNEGKADKLIMAVDMLESRIKQIRTENYNLYRSKGLDPEQQDLDPTLAQISETHIIHYQSKFKPFVPIGLEYQRITPQAGGGGQFGSAVTFSLSQFGDFFADMALNLVVSQASAQSGPVPAVPQSTEEYKSEPNQENISFTLPDDTVISSIDPSQSLVRNIQFVGHYDDTGRLYEEGEQVQDRVYYCDFPGERMIKKVSFEINGNPLDSYDQYSHVFYRNFKLKEDKKVGYYRNVGQELPVQSQSINFQDGRRYGGQVFNGLQTPKKVQPEFHIWQKLLFWFNLDYSLALPSAAIPFGQRYINIQFEDANKLLFRAPSIYTTVKVESKYFPGVVFMKQQDGRYDFSNFDVVDGQRNAWHEVYQLPVLTNGELNYPSIKQMNLYVNNIFTHPAIHDLYIKRIGFYLVRVHRIQQQAVNQSDLNLLLNNFKFPIEYLYVGVIPDENLSGPNSAERWHRFGKLTQKISKGNIYITPQASSVTFDNSKQLWLEQTRTIDSLDVTAHGVQLYLKIDTRFYNQYLPEVFGQHTIMTPKDEGLSFINFALFPGVFQPSGHINVSRAREFYIHIFSSVIGQPNAQGQLTSGQMITQGSALNFLLISDGSAVMRYST